MTSVMVAAQGCSCRRIMHRLKGWPGLVARVLTDVTQALPLTTPAGPVPGFPLFAHRARPAVSVSQLTCPYTQSEGRAGPPLPEAAAAPAQLSRRRCARSCLAQGCRSASLCPCLCPEESLKWGASCCIEPHDPQLPLLQGTKSGVPTIGICIIQHAYASRSNRCCQVPWSSSPQHPKHVLEKSERHSPTMVAVPDSAAGSGA